MEGGDWNEDERMDETANEVAPAYPLLSNVLNEY